MLAIPAIDIKAGNVVRLVQGRYEEVTVYYHDPVKVAQAWQHQGASRLHVVDLDGALAGELKNLSVIRQIIETTNIPVQLGGGIRSYEDVLAVFSMGAQWAILGTKACEDLDFAQKIVAEFGEKIIFSIDVKFKKVATRGWVNISEVKDVELIKKLQDKGAKTFIYTDISRDGTLGGTNVEDIKQILEKTGAAIIYSGGVSTLEDVEKLKALEKYGLIGIIVGKALYEDRIHLIRVKKILEA